MLKDVYEIGYLDEHYSILYRLLAEREEHESISHNTMPTYRQHTEFLNKKPYKGFYIIYESVDASKGEIDIPIGSIYVTYSNEIGIHIFKKYRRHGFGENALLDLMDKHKEKYYLANINPANEASIKFFTEKRKFKHIQNTYRFDNLNEVK